MTPRADSLDTKTIAAHVAADLSLTAAAVAATCELLAGGATVPFIARYRKEATGGLDEVQIRAIEERRTYVVELENRRRTILDSLHEQKVLSPELEQLVRAATTKTELEDLYLPFKPKRRTRATIARGKGLGPLAERILAQPDEGDPRAEAAAFVSAEHGVASADDALAGARDIAAEVVSEMAPVRAAARLIFHDQGEVTVKVVPKMRKERTKFEQYYDFREPARAMPSHRYLAIARGESEKVLRVKIAIDDERLHRRVSELAGLRPRSPFAAELDQAIQDGMKRLLMPQMETQVRSALKENADEGAVEVFAENLRHLLLAAPLGQKSVIGIDPGLRTGCKVAAVDATGRFLENTTIYPLKGSTGGEQTKIAAQKLIELIRRHPPSAIAVGNGTGGRETESFVRDALREAGIADLVVVQVSEAGASVYSASDVAREEFPELDLTVRGAISIARRLQDPLAELVKVEPKAIGVGQYQHDVQQTLLASKLGAVVESCVNHVGVALNTASAALLSYVSGVNPKVARQIVAHRERKGPFASRESLLAVSGLGPVAYQQCAGFLRIPDGAHPLDASGVHPERYDLVARIASDLGVAVGDLVGNASLAARVDIGRYVDDEVGEPTLRDIVAELAKPGRDPRDAFEPPRFRDDVRELADLEVDMTLEGVVTNVTAFGAFVDVGVHQDGLVHVSQLADRFVKDPAEVVKVGDRLTVRVLDVDIERKRISLSARKDPAPRAAASAARDKMQGSRSEPKKRAAPKKGKTRESSDASRAQSSFSNNPFASLKRKG